MTPEERDARTVFCMQLSARIRPRDLEEFFSSVGQVSAGQPRHSTLKQLCSCLRILTYRWITKIQNQIKTNGTTEINCRFGKKTRLSLL